LVLNPAFCQILQKSRTGEPRRTGWSGDRERSPDAVGTGQATAGRVIIAAATIMILVFSAFILSGQQAIGEIGIGLAAAVLLDAFLLRTLLVPALMHLSGRANWWLPGWLDRILPPLSIEPATEPPTPPTLTPAGVTHPAKAR